MASLRADLVRSGTVLGLATIGAAALQPVLQSPAVLELSERVLLTAIWSGGAAGLVLLVGRTWHELATWALTRPPAVSTAPAFNAYAYDREAVHLRHQERVADADDAEWQFHMTVIRFCVIGSSRGFSWRKMMHHCDRPTWDWLTRELSAANVLVPGAGRRPTMWAAGWDSPRVRVSLKHGTLNLPYPDRDLIVRW